MSEEPKARKMIITPEDDLVFDVNEQQIKFSHFQPTNKNTIKILLFHVNDDTEGIWACLSDKDMKDYKNNVTDKDGMYRPALLRNASIGGPPWGAYVPIKLDGHNRPTCKIKEINKYSKMMFNQVNTI